MPRLGCREFTAKELLEGLLLTVEARNRWAHSEEMKHM